MPHWSWYGRPWAYRRASTDPFATDLAAAGVAVVVIDLRGTGASTPPPSRRSRYGYADLADDVGAALAYLAARRSGRRLVLLGHSLGGQACALHLARSPESTVDGLALIAVGLPWYRSYPIRRQPGVLAVTQAIRGITAVNGVWPGWGFGGRQARGVIRDWAFTARHGRFPARVVGPEDLAAVRTPVLAVSVEGDQYTPAPTTDRLVALLPAAPVRRVHLTRAGAGTTLDLFGWARTSTPIAGLVATFAAELPRRS
jgi:predicted alpha/beta hydrolase